MIPLFFSIHSLGTIHFVDETGRARRCAQLPCPVSAATWSAAAGGLLVGGVDAVYLLPAAGGERARLRSFNCSFHANC